MHAEPLGAPVSADLCPPSPPTENMGTYDDIDADVLRNYQEFALVNIIYFSMKESTTSEQSARMTAMDSASKNACNASFDFFKKRQKKNHNMKIITNYMINIL